MSELPGAVVEYLRGLTIERRSPAYLLVDRSGRLVEWSGTLDYGLYGLVKDKPVTEQVYFLEGLLPLGDRPIVLPCVSTSSGWPAEIHLFAGADGDWVVLLDAKTEERQRWMLQEKADELALLKDRQAKLIEELDAFAHTVAHDLKGPLTNIIGFADLIDSDSGMPEEKKRSFLREVVTSGQRMNRIIEELLLLAGVRKEKVDIGPMDMAVIVNEACARLTFAARERGATILRPDSWPRALGHGPWVEEVWTNYISNAIKYGGDPPVVELGAGPAGDERLRFWVKDNGPGIHPDARSRLFIPHTRLDTARAQGHGLGLSIVRRIVERLGGSVDVQSECGKGSVFSFTLRRAPVGT